MPKAVVNEVGPPLRHLPLSIAQEVSGPPGTLASDAEISGGLISLHTAIEGKFSEVGGYKRAPIRAPRLSLAPHTSPARFKGRLVGFVARDRYEQ